MSRTQSGRTLVTCLAGLLIAVLAVPAPAMADAPTLLISLGIRETNQVGEIGDFMPSQVAPIEWFDLDNQSLALDGTWQLFSFDLGGVPITPFFNGNGAIDADRGVIEHIRFKSTGFGGPFVVWIDEVRDLYDPTGIYPPVDLLISSFDDDGTGSPFPDGAEVMFQEPGYSGSTLQYIAPGATSGIDNTVGHGDTHSVRVQWAFVDDDPICWLRLVTWNALAQPCPLIAEPNGPAAVYYSSIISFRLKGGVDCNTNGVPDDQDIAGGTSGDCNANGVPDECEAITLYVDDSATGLNDGTSWANAYVDLQDALAEAVANCLVSEIWVAAGTYKPDGGTGDVMLSFELLDGVALYGGFTGGETDLSQRPLDPDPLTIDPAVDSVLSGEIGDPGDPSDNSNNVVWADLVSSNGILDGFTVTAGNASIGTGFPSYSGGGMFIYSADPTVVNCTFLDNRAVFGGGGMAIFYGAPTVVNCTFYNNQNTTDVPGGGGMHICFGSPRVANCTFAQNGSHAGGGMYIAVGDPTVVNCTFRENLATDAPYSRGGGIYNDGGDPTVVNCTFWDNWNAPSSYPEGTGLYTAGGSPTVANCIFWDPVGAPQISGTLVVTYSNVLGGYAGQGNIDLDPMFADAPNGNLRLLPGSPCIDAANNLALPADSADLDGNGDTSEPIPFDLDGNPRRGDDPDTPDTGYGISPIVDMGAYELPGDCNGNGVPDPQDIAAGTSDDCNFNYVPDECEPDEDCNNNGTQDICDIGAGTSDDCNQNWVPDDCEPDFDGDGIIDVCDDDIDGDGVLNDDDACEYTLPGAAVDSEGRPIGDLDVDCDTDLEDYALFQQGFTGPGQ